MIWLDPELHHTVLWDHMMCAETSRFTEIRDLMVKAFKTSLTQTQQQVLTFFYLLHFELFIISHTFMFAYYSL